MICNCVTAKPLPTCTQTLIIAEVADTGIAYNAVLKTPDGRADTYPATNVYGTSKMSIEDFEVRSDTNYELWLTPAAANNIEERAQLTIGETDEIECINIVFYQVYSGGDLDAFETQEITLKE